MQGDEGGEAQISRPPFGPLRPPDSLGQVFEDLVLNEASHDGAQGGGEVTLTITCPHIYWRP